MTFEINPLSLTTMYPALRGQNILVVGGTGYIGKPLCNELIANQAEVTLISRDPFSKLAPDPHFFVKVGEDGLITWIGYPGEQSLSINTELGQTCLHIQSLNILDRTDIKNLERASVIVAGGGISDVRGKAIIDYAKDILTTGMLLALKNPTQQFILLSSTEVYGTNPQTAEGFRETDDLDQLDIPLTKTQLKEITLATEVFLSELIGRKHPSDQTVDKFAEYLDTHAFPPRWYYGISKRIMEELVRKADSTAILRISNVFGHLDMRPGTVMPAFINKAYSGEELVVSSGKRTRTFIHLADVLEAIKLVISRKVTGVFNIANPQNLISISDLACLVVKKLGSTSKIRLVEEDSPAENQVINIEKAKTQLGFCPKISLEFFLEEYKKAIDRLANPAPCKPHRAP